MGDGGQGKERDDGEVRLRAGGGGGGGGGGSGGARQGAGPERATGPEAEGGVRELPCRAFGGLME
ncbi:Hypothetical predicted protein [Marmota monax]|uniref:Uncharacterized protein n=1 Tax=Marmota monax TaxID=9995 RepID=A0A5E4D3X1_MARMO|nr:Hypothetical predicted protein [Marmota monax]